MSRLLKNIWSEKTKTFNEHKKIITLPRKFLVETLETRTHSMPHFIKTICVGRKCFFFIII